MTDVSKKRKDLEELLRSLLLTRPNGIPLRVINRDFEEMTGYSIPYREFGFSKLEQLLRELPTVLEFKMVQGEPFLFAKVDNATSHIANMIQKQKTTRSRVPKRNYNYTQQYNSASSARYYTKPPRMTGGNNRAVYNRIITHALNVVVPSSLKLNLEKMVQRYPDGLQIENVYHAYKTFFGVELNLQPTSFDRIEDLLKKLSYDGVLKLENYQSGLKVFPIHSDQTYDVPIAQNFANTKMEDQYEFEPDTENYPNDEHGEVEITSESLPPENWEEACPINNHVLNNMKKVMELSPDGLPITQFADKYKEVAGETLDLPGLGFNNIQELVNELEYLFQIHIGTSGEWILRDAQLPPSPEDSPPENSSPPVQQGREHLQPIPAEVIDNIYCLLGSIPDGISLSDFDKVYEMNFKKQINWRASGYNQLGTFLNDLKTVPRIRFVPNGLNVKAIIVQEETILKRNPAISETIFYEDPIPDDAVQPGESYTSLKVPESLDGDYFSVRVSTVDHPGRIWLQLVSETGQNNEELDELMNDLEAFYCNNPTANAYKMPATYIIQSMVCAVLYPMDHNWHRGCIVGKKGPTTVQVFYVDYGTIDTVDIHTLRLLKKCFLTLPCQAFGARMARLQPVERFWTKEATQFLLNMCMNKPVMTQITSRSYMNTISVLLCDTTGEDDVHLNNLLVTKGYASPSSDFIELRQPRPAPPLDESQLQDNEAIYDYVSHSPSTSYFPSQIAPPPGMSPVPVSSSPSITSTCPLPSTTKFLDIEKLPSGMDVAAVQRLWNRAQNLIGPSQEHPVAQPYEPPCQTQQHHSEPHVINMDIVRRLYERTLAKNNLPQAAVEPMNFAKNESSPNEEPATNLQVAERPQLQPSAPAFIPNSIDSTERLTGTTSFMNNSDGAYAAESSPASEQNPNQRRFSKRVEFRGDVYNAHLINYLGQPCFTSGAVSSFIFGPDIVKRILHLQKYPSCHLTVEREDFPVLFLELERYKAHGFTEDDTRLDKVVLYKLSDVMKLLNFFKHKSETLVDDIKEMDESFNPQDPYWLNDDEEYSDEDSEDDKKLLQEKLDNLVSEKEVILTELMKGDMCASNPERAENFLRVEREIADVARRLANLACKPVPKSAAEEAQEFLDRIGCTPRAEGDNQNDSPGLSISIETVTATPASSAPIEIIPASSASASILTDTRAQMEQNFYSVVGPAVLNPYVNSSTPRMMLSNPNMGVRPTVGSMPFMPFIPVPMTPQHMFSASSFPFSNMQRPQNFNPSIFTPNTQGHYFQGNSFGQRF